MRAAELPPFWSEVAQQNNLDLGGPRSTFAVAANGWSIELAPLQQQNRIAKVITADTRVFPGHQRTVVMSRFDLVPGSLEAVDIALPRGATCLGAWTANQAVNSTEVDAADSSDVATAESKGGKVVRLPLSLSRLAQSVEVMFDVPLFSARQSDFSATLLSVPVSDAWISTYALSKSNELETTRMLKTVANHDKQMQGLSPDETRAAMLQQRGLSLAASIVQMINDSSDILAERPTAESTTWIRPMIARYEDLAAEAGYPVQWETTAKPASGDTKTDTKEQPASASNQPAAATNSTDPRSVAADERVSGSPSWLKLNAKMLVHVKRYSSGANDIPFLFSNRDNLKGYQLQQIQRMDEQNVLEPVVPADSSEAHLQSVIVNSISMLGAFAVVVLLWPLKRYVDPVTSYPAFWLSLVALCGFFVAPIPVAASLLLVAISAPALPRKLFRRRFAR